MIKKKKTDTSRSHFVRRLAILAATDGLSTRFAELVVFFPFSLSVLLLLLLFAAKKKERERQSK